MFPLLDLIINATSSSSPIQFIPVTGGGSSIGDFASNITAQIGIFLGILGTILALPGVKTFLSHTIGIRKQQIDAGAVLLGTTSSQLQNQKDSIKQLIDMILLITPEPQKAEIIKKVEPILEQVDKDAQDLNNTINNTLPHLHPSTARMIRKV